jgi:carbon monoxide dehydrogenase subunit G
MKLEQSFEVQAPIDQVWDALINLDRVAPCLPGAAITDRDEDGTYHGTFQVKLGPTTAAYRGTIKIEDADAERKVATLRAKGTDKRGQGGANATIVNTLSEVDGGTKVEAVTDFSITGRLARFGRGGMIEDISNRLLRDFATCLQQRLGEGPPAAEDSRAAAAGAAGTGTTPPEPAGTEETVTGGGMSAPAQAAGQPGAAATGSVPPAAGTGAQAPEATASGKSPAETGLGGGGERYTPPPAAKPVGGLGLFFGVLWERIRGLFGGKRS